MTSQNLRQDIYDPKTLAIMDQAFAAIWNQVRADDPFRDYAHDCELRLAIGQKRFLNWFAGFPLEFHGPYHHFEALFCWAIGCVPLPVRKRAEP